ncbi:hypothetical protein BJ508DRAFT_308189 [Ascobolus immersus RN42]|uniref:Uncharacterized protein n=1 Tax=Ascobolus immersus RN42 TaxID=1160509 RepID=A0A3N4I2D3_ASCIM|nr:hypothetical protein BJ508DRAFT_308189 [Ascobolus immersus RN42]
MHPPTLLLTFLATTAFAHPIPQPHDAASSLINGGFTPEEYDRLFGPNGSMTNPCDDPAFPPSNLFKVGGSLSSNGASAGRFGSAHGLGPGFEGSGSVVCPPKAASVPLVEGVVATKAPMEGGSDSVPKKGWRFMEYIPKIIARQTCRIYNSCI